MPTSPPKLFRWYCWRCKEFSSKSYETENEALAAAREHARECHLNDVQVHEQTPATQ